MSVLSRVMTEIETTPMGVEMIVLNRVVETVLFMWALRNAMTVISTTSTAVQMRVPSLAVEMGYGS